MGQNNRIKELENEILQLQEALKHTYIYETDTLWCRDGELYFAYNDDKILVMNVDQLFRDLPSIKISPLIGSYNLHINSNNDVFPDPTEPKIPIVSPTLILKEISFNALILVSGYVRLTFLNSISSYGDFSGLVNWRDIFIYNFSFFKT